MNWENFVKRYVWDDDRTPYFVGVGKITRRQVDYESYVYAVFLGVLFGVITIAALAGGLPQGRSQAVALYGFTIVCSTILFGATKHVWAALYCSAAPLAVLFYLFHQRLSAQARHRRPLRADSVRARLAALLDADRGARQGLPRSARRHRAATEPSPACRRHWITETGRGRTATGRCSRRRG